MTTADVEAIDDVEYSRNSLLEEERLLELLNAVLNTEGCSAADLHPAFASIVSGSLLQGIASRSTPSRDFLPKLA